MVKRTVLGILAVLVVAFVAMQLVPVQRDNPPVVSEPNWDSPQTRELAQRACFDCHSNETNWPFYAYIAPFSWGISESVHEGRRVLNFSDWENVRGEARQAGEMTETIFEGGMPPASYLTLHPAARLSAEERQALVDGLRATVRASGS